MYRAYRRLERIAAIKSVGMSTLSSAVVPILEQRNTTILLLRPIAMTPNKSRPVI